MKSKRFTELGDWLHNGDPAAAHERLGNAWWAWVLWALVLEESAEFIWERSAYEKLAGGKIRMPLSLSVHAMLVGYAIECAFKGLWVKQGNKLVANGKYIGVRSASDHNLAQLAWMSTDPS